MKHSRKIFQNKTFLFLLIAYLPTQFVWPLSELLFLVSIVVAIIWISKSYRIDKSFAPISYSIILCFLVNLILTLIYIPLLILNPEINWSLQDGRQESDPMILLAYFPSVNFILFVVIILVAGLTIKVSELQERDSA
jgi:nitrogen fixation/metabolism regulation signal transduction histidine kinase